MSSMIAAAHTIIYAEDADRARAFFRDVLGFPVVDAGGGWLIFAAPPSEIAVHPGSSVGEGNGHHELFFMCHDIEGTVAALKARGVEFAAPITAARYGLMTRFKVPGAGEIGLYEPTHASPLAEFSTPASGRSTAPSRVQKRRTAGRPSRGNGRR